MWESWGQEQDKDKQQEPPTRKGRGREREREREREFRGAPWIDMERLKKDKREKGTEKRKKKTTTILIPAEITRIDDVSNSDYLLSFLPPPDKDLDRVSFRFGRGFRV